MFKKMLVSLMFIATLGFTMQGCAGIHAIASDPAKKQVADVIILEATGMVFDANPDVKPEVKRIAQAAKDLLAGNIVITKDGAYKWLQEEVAKVPGMNARAKRLIDVVVLVYLPNYSGSTFDLISQDDRTILMNLCDLLIASASA